MTTQAVQDDLFSILRRFTSPRMGPYDSTAVPAKTPPPDPQLSGSSGTPSLAGGAAADTIAPPVPVGRRIVPEGEAAVGSPQPPAPASPAAGTPPPAAGATPDFLAESPYYKHWLAQQEQRAVEARKQQGMDNIIGGLGGIANSSGGNVQIAEPTKPGSDEKTGSKYLSLDQFRKFSDEHASMKSEAEAIKRIDEIVKDPDYKGVSKTELLAIYKSNPHHFGKLIGDFNDPKRLKDQEVDKEVLGRIKILASDPKMAGMSENELIALYKTNPAAFGSLISSYNDPTKTTFTDDNGDVYERRTNAPVGTPPTLIHRDPLKAARAGTALDKERADANSAAEKATKEQEFRALIKNPEVAKQLREAAGVSTDAELQALFASDKLGPVLENATKGSSAYQDWLKTDRKKSFTQWIEEDRLLKSPTGGSGKIIMEESAKEAMAAAKAGENARAIQQSALDAYQASLDPSNEMWRGALYGDDRVQKVAGIVDQIVPGFQLKGISDANILKAKLGEILEKKSRTFGAAPSDTELLATQNLIGANGEVDRAALTVILRGLVRTQTHEQITAVAKLKQAEELHGGDPAVAKTLRLRREAIEQNIPDVRTELFSGGEPDALMQELNNPDNTPAYKAAVRRVFDKRYGAGWSDYIVGKDALEGPQQ